MLDQNIVIPVAAMLTAVIIVSVNVYTKYRLKVEQIKADAMVRAEEVRSKNQLELEKLIREDQQKQNPSEENNLTDNDTRGVREKKSI